MVKSLRPRRAKGNMFKKILKKFLIREDGQGLVEYALILVLVAIVVIAVLLTFGPAISQVYCRVANALQAGSCTLGGSGVFVSVTTGAVSSNRQVNVSVSQSTTVTISADSGTISSPTKPCPGSCTFLINSPAGSGSVTASDSSGSMTATW